MSTRQHGFRLSRSTVHVMFCMLVIADFAVYYYNISFENYGYGSSSLMDSLEQQHPYFRVTKQDQQHQHTSATSNNNIKNHYYHQQKEEQQHKNGDKYKNGIHEDNSMHDILRVGKTSKKSFTSSTNNMTAAEKNENSNEGLLLSSTFTSFTPLQIQARKLLGNESRPQPPEPTLGAFIHIGKAGGSTLTSLLRNGCHGKIPKPCNSQLSDKNETAISKLTTYYHTPDFIQNPKYGLFSRNRPQYGFYVFLLRDPFDRTISSYLFSHPDNAPIIGFFDYKRSGSYVNDLSKLGSEMAVREYYLQKHFQPNSESVMMYQCFPTLDQFAMLLENPDDFVGGPWKRRVAEKKCSDVAKMALLTNHAKIAIEHMCFSYSYVTSQIGKGLTNKTILGVRMKHMNQDWILANEYLGQNKNEVEVPVEIKRNSKVMNLTVSKYLSDEGRRRLCLALRSEYIAYLKLLNAAVNLSDDDKAQSKMESREKCPWLSDLIQDA